MPEATGVLKLGPSEVTVIGLLLFALLTGWMGKWVWGRTHEEALAEKDKTIADRDKQIVDLKAEIKHLREVEIVHWQSLTLQLLETGERNATVNERLVERLPLPRP